MQRAFDIWVAIIGLKFLLCMFYGILKICASYEKCLTKKFCHEKQIMDFSSIMYDSRNFRFHRAAYDNRYCN
jgi:hypothetical protein